MATLRTAVAAAARASSRRGSGLAGSRGGAGSGLAVLSSRGGAGSVLAVLSSRGGGGSLQLVRAFSDGGKIPKGQDPFWSWKTWRSSAQAVVKKFKTAEAVWQVAYTVHGVIYFFFTTAAAYALWYVEGSVADEKRSREMFERAAISGHQEHVRHTIESIEKLQEKTNKFWDRFLSYREDDLEHRDTVTKAADLLKKRGYVVVSAADFEAMDCKMSEMTEMLAEMSELKARLLMMIESKEEPVATPLKESVEKVLNGTMNKNESVPGDEGISNRAQPAPSATTAVKASATTAVKVNDKENGEVHSTEGQKTGSIDKMGAEGENTGSSNKTTPF